MHFSTFSTLFFLLGLTHAIPAPSILPVPDPAPTRPPCITLPVILTGLSYEFTLVAQSSADPTIDGSTITFSSTGKDSYTASFGPPGQVQNVTFQNSKLSLKDGALVAGTKVPRKTLWRQVGFGPKGSGLGELNVAGSYGCHPKTGASQLEIHPGGVSDGPSGRLREYLHQLLLMNPPQ